jgi:serine/threonine protein kinase/Flp pilus assembly protein TadD
MAKPPVDFRAALKGRFDVKQEIGRGGMGTVLLAHDTRLDRAVALKILTPEVSSALGAERFAREIRLTARLVHPNLVPLFDSGQVGDSLYYVMPFIDGQTLRQRLDREGPLAVDEVIRISADLAEALAYAHAMGAVHRDLKPENVFWYRGRALLADFGVALSSGEPTGPGRITENGLVIGSPLYLSPEQAYGEISRIDARSDLYTLGCVMFELLTGRPPFQGTIPMRLLVAHMTAPVPDAATFRADTPPRLSALIRQLMAKSPGDRPATAADLLNQLRGVSTRDSARTVPTPEPSRAESTGQTDSLELAIGLYVGAMQGGPSAKGKLELARVYLDKALARTPGDASALALLSDVVHLMGIRGIADFGESERRARELRYQALAADDSNGQVHTSVGVNFLYWEDQFELAGEELRRGTELAPSYPPSRRLYGNWLKIAGRPQEALVEMQAAVALAPDAPFMLVGLADILMTLGRYDEAIAPLRRAIRIDGGYQAAIERLENSCHRAGRHEEALDARRALLGLRGAKERMRNLTERAVQDGWAVAREADLRIELAELLERGEKEDPFHDLQSSYQLSDRIVVTLAELGEWTAAMDWVERAYHRRPGRLRRILNDLPYDHHGLASDPRYARILRTAGLDGLLM